MPADCAPSAACCARCFSPSILNLNGAPELPVFGQVKYLEAVIVFITIALALGVGTCCMHAINTPTRFETPRELRSGPHHE